MKDYLRINSLKIGNFITDIGRECEQETDFTITWLDIDSLLINDKQLKEEQIKSFEKKATREYYDDISRGKTGQDKKDIDCVYYDLYDRVLEEVDPKYKGRIDYNSIYNDNNLYSRTIEYVNYLLENRRPNDYVILLSHYNPEREAVKKIEYFLELFPDIDAVIPVKFHSEEYEKGKSREMTCKIDYLIFKILAPIIKKSRKNYEMIQKRTRGFDDSSSVRKKANAKGFMVIPFSSYEDRLENNEVRKTNKDEAWLKGAIAEGLLQDLNPIDIQLAISYHNHYFDEYASEFEKDVQFEEKLEKVLKLKR